MFYYYGAKNQLARHYPDPVYGTIIEPFAGSAAYAQHYGAGRKVILRELDDRVVRLWHHLQKMTADEIRALPCPTPGTYFADDEFMDQLVKMCAASNATSQMTGPLKVPVRVERGWTMMMTRMAERVDLVRSWKIVCGDYTTAPMIKATWFIDPPYQPPLIPTHSLARGKGYKYGSGGIDYTALRHWILDLPGQVIVCEREGATWLQGFDFQRSLKDSQGVKSNEVWAEWDNKGMSPEKYLQTHTKTDRLIAEAHRLVREPVLVVRRRTT